MGPLNDRSEFGFTGTFSQQNGGGFLTDHFPDAAKSIWEIDGYTVSSRHVPDVRYEGKIHPGLAGCAPSQELLEEWNEREQELIDKHEEDPSSIPNHPTGEAEPGVANPPTTEGAQMGEMDPDAAEEAAKEAARTVPPREHGGNHDIKDLSIGSTVYFPVYVEGRTSRSATSTPRRATARSPSAARSRWRATPTWSSTWSRTAWRNTASTTRSSSPATAAPTSRTTSRSAATP